ncbi:phosphoadenosine phosphosulfate reductase family protein [Allomuricauda sp. NBRC 101325]|uniref:phosphoadenosine phosphosulfate reductase domain-containing protein n=1 Tax=Allomuricauda sp. NBRC 101325 TaxID=1113758 RepID=UPI0024A49E3F|nr:phosphoadenosine phosphosulfate reductase family protein [Muricauda sp. NBRC 101325]GLU45407.1 hypothetical protein Musp01_30310 [Muricauda sp. NBRC 101325]
MKRQMVNHLIGISGGKDSAALAIYMRRKYPNLDIEYYTCDTGKELVETYQLIRKLNSVLGKDIRMYESEHSKNSPIENPFDHFLATLGGYLPSPTSRWCTHRMKLEPFETQVGNIPTISYVAIRGDEDREGFISKKENIQTIFPFRKNIWSSDVIKKVLANDKILEVEKYYEKVLSGGKLIDALYYVKKPLSPQFSEKRKLNALLNVDVKAFNNMVFLFLKTTNYPVGRLENFPLIENDEVLVLDDIFNILEESGVGVPKYYNPIVYEVEIDGEIKKGTYSRSRSGCYFCFYQQKIEWVWLLEQHPDLFNKAMEYEKDGYTWMEEPLSQLMKPDRVSDIKKEHYLRMERLKKRIRTQDTWKDEILNAEGSGCASCFI